MMIFFSNFIEKTETIRSKLHHLSKIKYSNLVTIVSVFSTLPLVKSMKCSCLYQTLTLLLVVCIPSLSFLKDFTSKISSSLTYPSLIFSLCWIIFISIQKVGSVLISLQLSPNFSVALQSTYTTSLNLLSM